MTLVFLYGPPAAGKLTVARELAALTGFRVFHNHLTNDLAKEIFPVRNDDFGNLVVRLRLDVFEAAARAGVSLISTFVYAAGPKDDAFVETIVGIVREHGGEVAYVQLLPSREVLRERVDAPSRAAHAKIRDWPLLESLLDANDLTTPLPNGLTLDNSSLSPEEAAARIASWLQMPRKPKSS